MYVLRQGAEWLKNIRRTISGADRKDGRTTAAMTLPCKHQLLPQRVTRYLILVVSLFGKVTLVQQLYTKTVGAVSRNAKKNCLSTLAKQNHI